MQKHQLLDAENLPCSARFGFAYLPCLVSRQVFQSQFTGGQENDGDAIACIRMQAERTSTADGFIIRMRCQNKHIHAEVISRHVQPVESIAGWLCDCDLAPRTDRCDRHAWTG